jgi:hypothetical protein
MEKNVVGNSDVLILGANLNFPGGTEEHFHALRDSSVGIATGYGLGDQEGWGVQVPVG